MGSLRVPILEARNNMGVARAVAWNLGPGQSMPLWLPGQEACWAGWSLLTVILFPLQQLCLWRYFQGCSYLLSPLMLARSQGEQLPNGIFVFKKTI